MILFTVVNPKCLLSLILETKVFRWVGGLSYGLYLWQHLFLNGSQEISPEWFSLLQSAYLSIPLTFVCAFLSYHLLELPLIKVGRKTSQKFSSY
jgi:peptidoglycan/LPS O-acetylase OafA/YrhL